MKDEHCLRYNLEANRVLRGGEVRVGEKHTLAMDIELSRMSTSVTECRTGTTMWNPGSSRTGSRPSLSDRIRVSPERSKKNTHVSLQPWCPCCTTVKKLRAAARRSGEGACLETRTSPRPMAGLCLPADAVNLACAANTGSIWESAERQLELQRLYILSATCVVPDGRVCAALRRRRICETPYIFDRP